MIPSTIGACTQIRYEKAAIAGHPTLPPLLRHLRWTAQTGEHGRRRRRQRQTTMIVGGKPPFPQSRTPFFCSNTARKLHPGEPSGAGMRALVARMLSATPTSGHRLRHCCKGGRTLLPGVIVDSNFCDPAGRTRPHVAGAGQDSPRSGYTFPDGGESWPTSAKFGRIRTANAQSLVYNHSRNKSRLTLQQFPSFCTEAKASETFQRSLRRADTRSFSEVFR